MGRELHRTRSCKAAMLLQSALERRGWGYREGAAFIGVSERRFKSWVSGERAPRDLTLGQQQRLCELMEWQVLPEDFGDPRRERRAAPPQEELSAMPLSILADQELSPDEELLREEREHGIQRPLPPRHALILQRVLENQRYGGSYEDISMGLAVSKAYISYIYRQALRRLRHPAHARTLRALM